MGVASIPVERKDQRTCHELRSIQKMDVAKGTTEDFVTVVSVGSQPMSENFVTVLSIGNRKKDDEESSSAASKNPSKSMDGHLEEEVEVFRLPGERLGFGLKFEGGNKTAERVRRLFVQSCAEQSPASRAKCSWGTLGEGDEVLSIDGIPVTHMTRLDCVRRLKESQLVIRLMVRCRGALRPEVVSAERKIERNKVPPELPTAPPPVPPRKLRQLRGSADGEANPSPIKKLWDNSKSQNGSQNGLQNGVQNGSSVSQIGLQCVTKISSYENCESKNVNGLNQESPKESPKDRSPEFAKSKQIEPPEAMVYLDARSQCGSTHGSTSDDTSSSMSTVVDRFSTSDRVSTISTTSTASTAGSEQQNEFSGVDRDFDRSSDRDVLLSRAICPLEHLERDFSNPPDYLLRRLASSEAVTHVESRGEVERITAVVAPNTVLIEETITLQPPLSFQDAPLSYGHEARPDLFYTADLAADSTTHFRPIKDDVELVERVNGNHEEFREATCVSGTDRSNADRSSPPPLPARNHVNRICVNQTQTSESGNKARPRISATVPVSSDLSEAPLLPPKPLPRKDVKARRKRPPPPPPPPIITPRREIKPSPSIEPNQVTEKENENLSQSTEHVRPGACNSSSNKPNILDDKSRRNETSDKSLARESDLKNVCLDNEKKDEAASLGENAQTSKVLETIEIKMAKSLQSDQKEEIAKNKSNDATETANCEQNKAKDEITDKSEQDQLQATNNSNKIPPEHQNSNVESATDKCIDESINKREKRKDSENCYQEETRTNDRDILKEVLPSNEEDILAVGSTTRESEDDETYQSLDVVNDDIKNPEMNQILENEEVMEEEDTTDESDDGEYYWQSNLATIGEEEETSLEYVNDNADVNDPSELAVKPEESPPAIKKDAFVKNARDDEADRVNKIAEYTEEKSKNPNKDTVNGKMENCGGGQRLPPDGDEFPAAYQEFSNSSNQPPYRYIAATRTATIATNGGGLCNENEPFRAGETLKMLANDSNVVGSRSIILPDSKMTFTGAESVRQDIKKVALANMENVRSEMGKATSTNVDNMCQDTKSSEITSEEKKSSYHTSEDIAKKNASIVTGSSLYSCQTTNNNLMMSEKKMEIAGYYHKDVTTIEQVPSHVEKDTPVDTPPPLPLTGPPKVEQTVLHARNVPTIESPQRKFSLNGDLWRQDDKSERSVRDKIAMFSSQSNLDAPLFPSAMTAAAVSNNGKRLSKYKSSEDVCCDDKNNGQKDRPSFFADRTQSSFDLTDSAKTVTGHDSAKKYNQRTPSLSQIVQPVLLSPTAQTTRVSKTIPIVLPKTTSVSSSLSTSYDKQNFSNTTTKNYCANTESGNLQNAVYSNIGKTVGSCNNFSNSLKTTNTPSLTRATSFSGPTPYTQDRDSLTTDSIGNSQISRTNSLASTFKRPGEDVRRNSLNQLIEQRRRSISKLRGLVIPEKDTVSIDQPIIDLPEIKSRDSILLHQIPKANIQDKWGSQSSLASNASTASQPLKATTSFKMPAPQIHSKYSPAFKRKSLTVYGTSVTTSSAINGNSPIKSSQSTALSTFSEPPKSLESICSPTRSDYSFEFASTTSSPDGSRTRPRTMQRKARLDYDDSDNDSAVSSSQSSISRGFSPPMSPVPSERSTISSERSYVSTELNCQRRPLIADNLNRISVARDIRDPIAASDKDQFASRIGVLGERMYLAERSSSSSSSSNSRSPQPNELVSRSSQIPQRQLRRSNSTDTNCSTSSTLTSGSQASAESLSRRVLKPQSVEAINRKNILASARCRSGRDLNGSPLIQRKFSDDEDAAKGAVKNGGAIHQMSNNSENDSASKQEIKIAYIEVADPFAEDEGSFQKKEEKPKLPPKMSFPPPAVRPPKPEILEPSNDLKMWVRAEVKTLARSMEEKSNGQYDKGPSVAAQNLETRSSRGSMFNESVIIASNNDLSSKNRTTISDTKIAAMEMSKSQNKASLTPRKSMEEQNDLLTILTTKSRSRSAIHVDEGTFGRSKSQMSLEDILGAKADLKLLRAQNSEPKIEKNGMITSSPVKSAWEISKENRYGRRGSITSNESWSEDRPFVSKIPTLGKSKVADSGDEMSESVERMKSVTTSKIPTSRGLNRRSASVTDMKKALEKVDTSPVHSQLQQSISNTHNRFPSLDSSVDENVGTEMDSDRCYGSISSLASSTSLISQQELAQLVEEASLEEARGAHDVIVVLLHKENPTGSVGITLAGGADCEVKEITVHRVLTHSIADKDGRVQRGDRILSINGRSTRGLTHRESMAVLKQPRSEVVLVVSRVRMEEGCKLRSRTASVETIVEGNGIQCKQENSYRTGLETNGNVENTAWGPPSTVAVYKDGAGLGFSLEGGRDSPLGDRPLIIKKIFTGGAAEKTGALKAGDQLLEVNGNDVTRMSRIEAWSLMKKLHDGEVNLLVRHPATKSS
ncbi:uncharacterized protein LOC105195115 isoform X2 [Solenopsis invicta]|uniref:uncharacterized protein LOC105195115 isoform X2 n=1 Tax=Solenopsis invicta TaxID=13686 RepID=UPI00193D5B49|nr:uncharacterized protein LOC105195115 isoform X2 [Solenopsis invicta]